MTWPVYHRHWIEEDMMVPQTSDRGPAAMRTPPVGRRYAVGDRQLFLHRSGSGGPAVVFLPGAAVVGLEFLNIHERVAQFTTSVLYDRGGTGWSDPVELPRTATDVATELHELLRVAGIPAPYVLVAHSMGGAYARRFAQLFPDDVAGVVGLEAFYEEWDTYMPEHLHLTTAPEREPGKFQLALLRLMVRPYYRKVLRDLPRPVRDALVAGHASPEWVRHGAAERGTMAALRDELKAGGPVPDRPLIALTGLKIDAGQRLFLSRKSLQELNEGKLRLFTALTRSVANGEHRVLDRAAHSTMQIDAPDAVVRAIRDMIGRVAR